MLILTRGISDRIVIGDDIVLTVVRIRGQRVQIGVEAPPDVRIRRSEMLESDFAQSESPQEAILTGPAQRSGLI